MRSATLHLGPVLLLLLVLLAFLIVSSDPGPKAEIEDTTRAPRRIDANLVHRSDYPLCVTVAPPPLLRLPLHKYDYRPDRRAFNDKGTA